MPVILSLEMGRMYATGHTLGDDDPAPAFKTIALPSLQEWYNRFCDRGFNDIKMVKGVDRIAIEFARHSEAIWTEWHSPYRCVQEHWESDARGGLDPSRIPDRMMGE